MINNNEESRGCWRMLCAIATVLLFAQGPMAISQDPPQNTSSPVLEFEVTTVKATPKDYSRWLLQFTPDGFTARGVTVRQVIQEAYGIYQEERVSQGPSWLTSDHFDIQAKIDVQKAVNFRELSLNQRRIMLQQLLADRFKLKDKSAAARTRLCSLKQGSPATIRSAQSTCSPA
jgi:hypothetical protein